MQTLLFLFAMAIPMMLWSQKNDNPEFFLRTHQKKIKVITGAAQFKSGEWVADIGAGGGWLDAALGIHTDSLHFTLEEIDSSFFRESRLHEALTIYETVRARPITSSYQWAIGSEKSTGLPGGKFDKVLLIDTYHHIEFRDDMIGDMFLILKSGGKLIVLEPVAGKPGDIYKGCQTVVFTPGEIIASFCKNGFIHERTLKTVKSARQRVRVFVFTKA
jgi:hypothetical protein